MQSLHILVTDDDVNKRLLVVRALLRQFPTASIFECHNGQEALEYFLINRVDLVVTNHSMAPINGLELVSAIRATGADTPIVMITGSPEVQQEAEAAGVDLFVDSHNLSRVGKPIAELLLERGVGVAR